MNKLFVFSSILLLTSCAGIQTPLPEGIHAITEKNVEDHSKKQGCQLIIDGARRNNCVTNNQTVHTAQTCDATACQKTAGKSVNGQRLAFWQSCVQLRTDINGDFSAEKNELERFKQKTPYKRWNQKAKTAMNTLISKIAKGQPTHSSELNKAKAQVKICQKLI